MPEMFSCENLLKRYGAIDALRSVSLSVEAGLVGLLGPNGAGKSTLISVLLGQAPATSGRASVCGLDVARQQLQIRRRVGFMPENDCLIPGLTGAGYVCYVGKLAGMSHRAAMQRTHEVLDYVEMGEERYRPAEQYSAGMKQRLKLAQALVHDPDVLFLDEPTNGMDPQGRQSMLSLITDLGRAGISVLLSSHLLPDVERVCQRVVIMGGGEILSSGDIEEMRQTKPTRYTVDFVGDGEAFCRRLSEQAVAIRSKADGSIAVELPDIGEEGAILRSARETNTKIRGLHPERSTLEETFMTAITRQQTQ